MKIELSGAYLLFTPLSSKAKRLQTFFFIKPEGFLSFEHAASRSP